MEYDELNNGLRVLSESINSLKIELAKQNAILKIIANYPKHNKELQIDFNKYINKNLVILHDDVNYAMNIAKEIAKISNQEIKYINYNDDCDIAEKLTSLNDNDYIFVNYNCLDLNCKQMVINAIKENALNFIVGKGSSAKEMSLKIKSMHYIIYADMIEMLPKLPDDFEIIQ